MTDQLDEDLPSLQRQLAEARENLRLVEEREAEFPLSTDIPLLIVKEKRRLLERIAELEQRSARVAPVNPKVQRRAEREAADQRAEAERQTMDDRSRETMLQNYLDKMTELLLEKNLSSPGAPPIVRDIARARTVTTLRQLDATRRNLLLGFLRQAHLIDKDDPVQLLWVAYLSEADLSGANLRGVKLSKADLIGANLSEADLSRADLSGANLPSADLSRANLFWTNLSGANLSSTDLTRAILGFANLSGADLSEAKLSGANLILADLSEAKLSGADLSGANLSGANLSGADLRGAKLKVLDLHQIFGGDSDLIESGPVRADLSGADLSEADLSRADLSGTRYNNATQWPKGFTPVPEAIKVEDESTPPPAEVKEAEP